MYSMVVDESLEICMYARNSNIEYIGNMDCMSQSCKMVRCLGGIGGKGGLEMRIRKDRKGRKVENRMRIR